MEEMNKSFAFVVYDESGAPIAYILHRQDELSEGQMRAIMEIFEGVNNAETWIEWREEE